MGSLHCIVLPQTILDDEFTVIVNPLLILEDAVLLSPFDFEISSSILESLLLDDLIDFSTHCRQFLELFHLEAVQLCTDRNATNDSHRIGLLRCEGH